MRSEPEGRFHTVDVDPVTSGVRRAQLRTSDGVRIEAVYQPCRRSVPDGEDRGGSPEPGPAIVVAHGFTGSADRPAIRRAADAFAAHAAVVTFSFRGHGRSGGHSTLGDREVLDLVAAIAWARAQGHPRIATVGFSMGGSVVLRHAALYSAGRGGRTEACTDAVAAVSAPARWYYRGTPPMRRVQWMISHPLGRAVGRYGLRTRIHDRAWDPVPLSPVEAVPLIAPTPLLIVHGDRDAYFPVDHPRMLAAAGPAELWLEPGMGHAESAAGDGLLERLAVWLTDRAAPADGP
ncbi:alpha/beta hydrolase family protein [Streptomyces qinzhouensis]|uniref:Alpha/beta fold hydrolase n=1 Tax=Streptomyces qinzhouensis TaxID=2599401 RepID=A0A5B8JAY8_9ACTN|nr:alpha/beta fold hydrolase [Streptomyces qinzhouensis]QDY77604.1 alpha/beta fold hydrolase [Streptomyces qinzhouensis]